MDLEGLTYEHPFGIRKGRVVFADYVSGEEGTGLVHTAPGHGAEDYRTGIKYKLDIVMPVDSKGNFDGTAGEFKGLNVYEANKLIIEKLDNTGALLFSGKVQHSYPHCWRCKSPIIFRATKQWFLEIDKGGLRGKLLEVIDKEVEWIPAVGKERISAMVSLRPDWCLSRQRYWGVPIPALVCNDCREEFLDVQVIENFAEYVSKEGSECWFIKDTQDFTPKGLTCPKCKSKSFSKGSDILDVWFDSGVSHQAVLKKRKELEFPCSLYLEGSDQHRGWFQSSLIPSMCIDSKPPFKGVLTHGHVVDGEGRKMSKSMGNVIPPQDVIKKYGADIVRLWVASSDYNEDIRISPEIILRLVEAYRKIRNTARFIISNLYDFNPDTDKVPFDKLKRIDKWALFKSHGELLKRINSAYASFEFYKVYQAIYDFCNIELSAFYLDMVKGRLYTGGAKSEERLAAQTAIYEILNLLLRVMAPVLVFTSEDIWKFMPKENKYKDVASVHLLEWPEENSKFADALEGQEMKVIFDLMPDITKALEEKRSKGEIGSSFDAQINVLTNSENRYKYLESLRQDLPEILKVSALEIVKTDDLSGTNPLNADYPDIGIEVLKAKGNKCERCWNYSESVGRGEPHSLLCEKCLSIIQGGD
jgi:isoleucyl-tRNA synthetase